MSAESTDWLKWSWVAGCLVAAAFRLAQAEKRRRGQADLRLLVLGLSMTAAADFLMVICGRDLEGLYCFLAVQLFYSLRLGRGRKGAAAWLGIACALWAGLPLFWRLGAAGVQGTGRGACCGGKRFWAFAILRF